MIIHEQVQWDVMRRTFMHWTPLQRVNWTQLFFKVLAGLDGTTVSCIHSVLGTQLFFSPCEGEEGGGGQWSWLQNNSKGSLSVTFFLVNSFERVYYIYTAKRQGLENCSTRRWQASGEIERVLEIERREWRGRILGRNWDKSLKSFPPCYSQSPLLTPSPPSLIEQKLFWNWFVM